MALHIMDEANRCPERKNPQCQKGRPMDAKYDDVFGDSFMLTMTNEERKYLALSPLDDGWETQVFYSKTNLWRTRTTVFFDGTTVVKVIVESKKILDNGCVPYGDYTEYDTRLLTEDRKKLLPLTPRGKPKPLTPTNIGAVTPFGCRFSVIFEQDTRLYLGNPRANRVFPLGEWDAVAAIRCDGDFHRFMDHYIATCRGDYFDKLRAFRTAQKVTVKYRPGDIFRMELDRNRYCYGIITGQVKRLLAIPELPEKHSLRNLMMVPIMVRLYELNTENPDLKAEDLRSVPLGRVLIAGDNDIIWGTHTIVDHRPLSGEDLEFPFVCTRILSHTPHTTPFTQDLLMAHGLMPDEEYSLYIEWGFARTTLVSNQCTQKLKQYLADYRSPHGGVSISIDPRYAVPDKDHRQFHSYRANLLNPENREFLNEIFTCIGLEPDATFDRFAEMFHGLTLREIAGRIQ